MILIPKYSRERVQKHQIKLRIQYHGLGTSIGAYIIGNAKNHVKKDPKSGFSNLSGGGLLALLYGRIAFTGFCRGASENQPRA